MRPAVPVSPAVVTAVPGVAVATGVVVADVVAGAVMVGFTVAAPVIEGPVGSPTWTLAVWERVVVFPTSS